MNAMRRKTLYALFNIFFTVPIYSASPDMMMFVEPLTMTRKNVEHYFKNVFNREGYGTFSLSHLDQFIKFGSTLPQGQLAFLSSMIDVFLARIKESLYVNPVVANDCLKTMIQHLAPVLAASFQLQVDSVKDEMRAQLSGHMQTLKQTLAYELKNGFYVLKFDPELFLQRLTEKVIEGLPVNELAHQSVQTMLKSEALHVRAAVVRLIETFIERLVWSPTEEGFAWANVKDVADSLFTLYRYGIIPDEHTLHQLYWTLTYRFVYCIGLIGEHISPATYALMKADIMQSNSILLTFSMGEQPFVKSRKEWLVDALFSGEVRARIASTGTWIGPFRSEYDNSHA
jgi:hypothetical protein